MKHKVVVIGGGTAGLIAGISIIRICPHVCVTLIRSTKMGHIMVGEGTFAATPIHLHDVLGIPRQEFCDQVNPTWKLGLRLLWGPRPFFDYPFNEQFSSEALPSTRKAWGYYCLDEWAHLSGRVAIPNAKVPKAAGYHIENQPFIEFLERFFISLGGELIDGRILDVELNETGVMGVRTDDGQEYIAEIFVDASGFRGELIHRRLGEPYISMRNSLFCDRAVVGGWQRCPDEQIKLYTTAETMDSGWCWRIEHEHVINRGYVYSSAFTSDADAAAEFMRKNPKVGEANLRIVPFESRYIRRPWVKNVVAVGNASGFVEPLEATNIQVICIHALRIAEVIKGNSLAAAVIDKFNQEIVLQWENIRDFIALHYRFNTRLTTPFWTAAIENTPLGTMDEYVKQYQKSGPILLTGRSDIFHHDGPLALLLGMCVPWSNCSIR